MKNNRIVLLLLLVFAKAGAQSKVINITVDKQLLEYKFLDEGGFYLQFGKITSMMEGPRLDKEVMLYSAALEKNGTYDLKDIALKVQGYLRLTVNSKASGIRHSLPFQMKKYIM